MATIDKQTFKKRYFILMALLALAIYIVIPQFGEFSSSWSLLRDPQPVWVLVAICFTAFTFAAGAATYRWLAFKPLPFGSTVIVQLAAMFINRLLPGGIGALGANYAYLRKTKHTQVQATTVVAVNNVLGFLGHGTLLAMIIIISLFTSTELNFSQKLEAKNLYYILLIIIVISLSLMVAVRSRFSKFVVGFWQQLKKYRIRRTRLAMAFLSSMSLTLANVLSLYFCALALGVEFSLLAIFLIFTFGVGAGVVTPTPGGLGGFEAGLVAGLIAYGVDDPLALAIALLYRLISYWLALGVGCIAFIVCQRRKLLFG